MTQVKDIYAFLQAKAPFELQMDFDNAGFLVGRENAVVTKILVSLDVTEAVIQEAIGQGAQLIVSHHPVIWGKMKSLTDQTPMGHKLLTMAEHHIACICAHTNLDAVEGGVNDALAQRLGLAEITQLKQEGVDSQGRPYGIGRVGYVAAQSFNDFALKVKELLDCHGIRLVDSGKLVHKVAVGGGACAGMIGDALALECDTFVTSDVKYDSFLEAKALRLNLIDAGHYPTENVICPVLQDWLRVRFPQVSVMLAQCHHEVFSCL